MRVNSASVHVARGSCLAKMILLLLCLGCSVYGQQIWSRAIPASELPSPRIDAPIAYDSGGKQLFLFGGQDASGDRNDLWSYAVDTQQWKQIHPSGEAPNARHGHTVTFDPVRRRIIVIAGQAQGFFNDTWAYDIQANAWRQLSPGAGGPNARYGLSAVYDAKRDRIVISHGFTFEGRFDDTWAFDLRTNAWQEISPAGTRPLRRCLHHAVYVAHDDQMLLYGGCSSGFGPCPQGDLWSFDLEKNQWRQIVTAGSPPPRQRYGMVFDDNRNRLVLFGGLGGLPLNDTWEFGPAAGEHDPAAGAWTQIAPAGDTPVARYRLEAAYASDAKTAFFFGGETTGFTNDLLLLTTAGTGAPQIAADGITDVFSAAGGPFAPGEIVAIYGKSLGPTSGVTSAFDAVTRRLPTLSGNVSVAVNGIPAPLYFVSDSQVNVQIPYELDGQNQASVSVTYNGSKGAAQTLKIAPRAPKIYPRVLNQDGTLNTSDNLAVAGDIVTLFATGQGITSPPAATGSETAAPYPQPIGAVRVLIDGQDAEITFAGLAPGTAGVMQVNARIPVGVAQRRAAPVFVLVGEAISQTGVAIAVR